MDTCSTLLPSASVIATGVMRARLKFRRKEHSQFAGTTQEQAGIRGRPSASQLSCSTLEIVQIETVALNATLTVKTALETFVHKLASPRRPPVLNGEAVEAVALNVTSKVTTMVDGYASTAMFCVRKCASLHWPPVQHGPPSSECETP
mmetsp:Transcript_101544/g.201682  ORF Transcript_101544/g.201682 Transcript_101544/m.201682 type:complete len:148 (-) Transcript_101544:634-1077(-)